jgi:hypothetical protein
MNNIDMLIQSEVAASVLDADNLSIAKMMRISSEYHAEEHEGNRLRIHLVLQSQCLADRLKRVPLSGPMAENVELYAYTREDLWAMQMLGINPESDTRLDRQPITSSSSQYAHLLIFGSGNQAESLAVHAALTSHYPNYCRDHSLRTRITMVADTHSQHTSFQQRYRNLLLNSYRRLVTIKGEEVECAVMEPKYAGIREDFVDVEWEFVEGHVGDVPIAYKLQQWSRDENQQLTIAFCYSDDERNLSESLAIQSELNPATPIWTRIKNDTIIKFFHQSELYPNVIPFGMDNATLPNLADYVRLAQCVNFAYRQMRSVDKDQTNHGKNDLLVALEMPSEQQLQELWNSRSLTTPKRWSNLYNAYTLRSKMNSLGHPVTDWGTLFAVNDRDVELLAEVEHNRWSVEELILGYRPTTEDEHAAVLKDISRKEAFKREMVHEDLRSYNELGDDESGLSVKRYDIGFIRTLSLVAYTYYHLKDQSHE